MKPHILLSVVGASALIACTTTTPSPQQQAHIAITLPSVVQPPDFRHLSTKSCKNGEYIHTPAVLALNKQGQVTAVSGLTVKDKQLAHQISEQFKKSKYTPYLRDGKPFAHKLDVAVSLKCPRKNKR
ncbi:MAG: hypothetical protein Q3971_04010 [Moraxella sp.]|nr:hypothetical protein [Moraxella sp.]